MCFVIEIYTEYILTFSLKYWRLYSASSAGMGAIVSRILLDYVPRPESKIIYRHCANEESVSAHNVVRIFLRINY